MSIPGTLNFRDVGGLPARGGVTREKVLFRSGNLAGIADEGRAALQDLGIRRIVDLREDDELRRDPSPLDGLGIDTVRAPLFLGSTASFFALDVSLAEMYRGLLDDAADRLVEVVRAVVADQPVLVHCTVGKDRTGVTVALILAAAGVDDDDIVADYARTEALLPAARNARIVSFLRSLHPDAVHLEELATRSPAPVMRAMLADLRAHYGTPVDYLRAHGLADAEVDELRRVLVRVT